MGKLALIANVGPTDAWNSIPSNNYIKSASIPFFKYNNVQDVSVHKFIEGLKKSGLRPSEKAMDLLIIACTLYAADTRIERSTYSEDAWTRMIDLFIPVSDVNFWDSHASLLEKIFRFLTGDIWKIQFRSRTDPNFSALPPAGKRTYSMGYQTDTVCLFSGGMDSFIGAIDLLENGIRPILVSHSKSSDVKPYQENCYSVLKNAYPSISPARIYSLVRIPKKDYQQQKLFGEEDHTERGRSFLFLALGSIVASCLTTPAKLIVPENGMISLNIPLTPLRIGSHSTRTTHPFYFTMMQTLLDSMQLNVTIYNPYQFKTKGEMLNDCQNKQLVATTETMSCSHPDGRWQGLGTGHCGYCVPCIIRRAAYKAAGVNDNFGYRTDIFATSGVNITKAEGADVVAFKYMIEKVSRTPLYVTAAIRNTGPLGTSVDRYVDVYKRSLDEVNNLLANVSLYE